MKLKKIFDASDRARELGQNSYVELIKYFISYRRQMILKALRMSKAKRRDFYIPEWNGGVDREAPPLIAYINGGRWLAACDKCSNIEFADRKEDYVFCHVCGNGNGRARVVLFPSDIKAAEKAALLRSPQLEFEVLNTQQAAQFCPSVEWYP